MYCTVLLPSENGIVTEVQGSERDNNDMVATKPAVERESRHTWFFNTMLKAIERNLTAKFGELTPLDRMKVEVSQGAPGDYRRWEVPRLQRVDQIVRASPNIRPKHVSSRDGRIHHEQMEETKCRPRARAAGGKMHERHAVTCTGMKELPLF